VIIKQHFQDVSEEELMPSATDVGTLFLEGLVMEFG
jgi:hypothetical protein